MKTKKIFKRALTLLLTLLMLLSTSSLALSAAQVEVAETGATIVAGDIIWYNNSNNWSTPYIYVWGSDSSDWPGYPMTKDDTSGNYYWISNGTYTMCIFSNNGSNQTGDLTIGGAGYLYNGSSWSSYSNEAPVVPVSDDLLSVLKGEKIMFYIGMPTSWGNNTTTIYLKLNGSNVALGASSFEYSSSFYLPVCAAATSGYYVSNNNSWGGNAISGTPVSGGAYLASGSATVSTAYTVSASLESNSITVGSNATISNVSASDGHLGKTTQVKYYVTSDGSEFTELSCSNTTLETSELEVGTYTVYPVLYDGYVYTRGNAISLTVADAVSEHTVTFVNYDGTVLDTQTVKDGESATAPTVSPREGYTFTGWSDGTNTYKSDTLPTITADTTFTAQYTINTYDVTVNSATGGSASANTATVTHGSTVELTATADTANGYAFTGWDITGTYDVVSGTTSSASLTIKVYSNITAKANFQQIPTNTVQGVVGTGEGEVSPVQQEIAEGSSVIITATPADGFRFSGWLISGDYTPVNYSETSPSISIIPLSDVTATANFIKTYTVTFVDMNGDTISKVTVDEGADATAPSAPAVDHYTFSKWDTDYTNVTSDLTVKAVYTANTYTVAVTAGTGGTAQTSAESVTYPNTVTLTADPSSTDYVFAGWEITGDYEEVSSTANTITIRPEGNVTANATFSLGQYLTVYTYSDDGYKKLTLTESNGTTDNTVINGVAQPSTETFNGVTWDKSEEAELKQGYSNSVTAVLAGEGTSSDTVIYVDFSKATSWRSGHYLSITASSNSGKTISSSDTSGAGSYAPKNDAWLGSGTLVSGSTYMWTIPSANLSNLKSYGFTVWSVNESSHDQVWQTDVSHIAYNASYNTYEVSSSRTYHTDRQSYCFTLTASSNTMSQSDSIDLTSTLYNGTAWRGESEVWIYQSGTTEVVTLRRDLLNLVTDTTTEYNGGTNSVGYTDDSWSAFVTAYDNAYSVSGAAASTQKAIDDAYTALDAAYKALELEAYFIVSYTQNDVPYSASIGTTQITTATGTVNVVQNKEVTVTFTAPTNYYIVSVKIGEEVVATNLMASYSANYTFTKDTTIEVVYAPNPTLSYQENGATGGTVTFTGNTHTADDGTVSVSYGYDTTLNITAPDLYYINTVVIGSYTYTNTVESKTTYTSTITEITADTKVIITYIKRETFNVEVLAYPTTGGTLYYGETEIPAEGTTIEVLAGESVTITAVPNSGYGVYYWVADTVSNNRESSYTFSNINANHTLDIEWIELEQVTVTTNSKPGTAGTATVDGSSSVTVDEFTKVTLSATVTDTRYAFVSWTIEGSYNTVDTTTRYDATFNISANSNIKATANFEQVNRRIYLKNVAGWSSSSIYIYCYDGNGDVGKSWPGYKMTYDSTLGFYYADVPLETVNIIFNKGHNDDQSQVEYKNIGNENLYTNGSDKTGYPTSYVEPGYYLQGKWNGATFDGYDLVMFTDNGDGTYTLTLTVTSTTDGYIYVNPTNEKSYFWNAATAHATGNPQTLVATGAYQSSPNFVKVEIDTSDYTKAYDVTFTFNPTTGEFSWTKAENVPTISIIGTDGRGINQADADMSSSNDRVGDTYFDADTVNRVNEHTYYAEAQVVAGSPVTFYTQVNDNGAGGYDYYVAGWVVNGTEFVSATALGKGLYSGSYVFTEDSDIVPIYFHTNDWLTAKGVKTVTVYAVADKTITNWDEYFAAYTWYKTGGTTKYEQFGNWPGQLMIPVAGLDGVYYTIIETTSPDGVQISGISFNNYSNGDTIDVVVHDHSNIQTYDYYEFIALLEDGKENITFVIKDTNDTYNSNRVSTSSIDITNGNWDFVQYTDYSGLKTDIFGNNIESIDSTLSDDNALYIIQAGNKNVTDSTLDGQYYVECYLYNASGTYLGKCYSYELHDEDSAIWTTLSAYKNQRAYISYETVNGARYDGEWYGDSDVSVTVNLAVNVALMTNGSFTAKTDSPVNEADYGTGYINATYQNVDVTRGATVTITATPKTGYKFVGWYSADGSLFTTNTTITVTAAIGTTYTAVFEALEKGNYYVNHYIYQGVGTSSYVPSAHGGNAVLYVGIDNQTKGTTAGFSARESAYIAAEEGDMLLITIATDATGADKFYAWYTNAVDKYGLTTFEEVGVDSVDNIYNNNGTVVGRNDIVYFQFYYTVKDNDSYSMTLYSDLMPVSVNVTLVYQYTDRYENVKSYYVPYTLTTEEVEGFEGNGNTPYTPAYISGDGWVNTIIANAPRVEDYYKDTTWKINSAMYDTMTFHLWATQPYTTYTVTTTVTTETGSNVVVNKVPYNTVVDLDIREIAPDASYTGFWYNDVNNNGTYESTVDIMLTYGPYYGYRVTQNMAVNYQPVNSAEDYEFNVSLDAPVYGREQTTDDKGNNKTDVVVVDYLINIITPYFYLGSDFTPIYKGEVITDADWNKTLVTIESLEDAGYTVEYGVILQQVGTFKVDADYAGDFTAAEAAAKEKGYGTATDAEILKSFLATDSTKGWIGETGTYGYKYDASNHNITNKNRVLFVFEHNNTESNQNRFYNVYSYLTVTTPDEVTTTYISNVQTLNIYTEGNKDAVVENNTSFA
ncbi:MAG: starch-binding protein [Ruminococcus sp.]|nr:starch-binding protein [Ruminococcus sp.]